MPDPIFSAIEAHRTALSEWRATVAWARTPRDRTRKEAERRTARQRYDAATDALVTAPIGTTAGLLAFTRHLTGLHAYGQPGDAWEVEVWHLSDALDAVACRLAALVSIEMVEA